MHGAHQVAHRLSNTGLPRKSASERLAPLASVNAKAGAASPLWLRSSLSAAMGAGVTAFAPSACCLGADCLSQPPVRLAATRRSAIVGRKDGSNAMWGGRFAEGPSAVMREINASIPFDKRLWQQDIAGSKAHVAMLGKQ